jgi:hypothetical protein
MTAPTFSSGLVNQAAITAVAICMVRNICDSSYIQQIDDLVQLWVIWVAHCDACPENVRFRCHESAAASSPKNLASSGMRIGSADGTTLLIIPCHHDLWGRASTRAARYYKHLTTRKTAASDSVRS